MTVGVGTASARTMLSTSRWDLWQWRTAMVPDENHVVLERELEDLPPDECFRLLATADVGRLVYQDDLGPIAMPVNYAMAEHDIVFRIERGAKQTAARQQQMLAFEASAQCAARQRARTSIAQSWDERNGANQILLACRNIHARLGLPGRSAVA